MIEKKKADYWMPVDQYIGGIEHAIMHLMYARFWTKVMRDFGLVKIDEPFSKLLCQGMVLKDGQAMSKSVGNVVDPGPIVSKYGADTARLFMLGVSLPEKELEWSDMGVEGSYRFLKRVYNLVIENLKKAKKGKIDLDALNAHDLYMLSKTHSTIKRVTELNERMHFSLAISALNEYVTQLNKYLKEPDKNVLAECFRALVLLISPFTPHVAEELWEKLGEKGFVSRADWPRFNERYIDEKLELGESLVRQTASDITEIIELVGKKPSAITLFVAPEWKYRVYSEVLKGRELKELMKDKELKEHGREVAQYFQNLSKRKFELSKNVLKQSEELKTLEESKKALESAFNCKVNIASAYKSDNPKAKSADVMRPGIFVEV